MVGAAFNGRMNTAEKDNVLWGADQTHVKTNKIVEWRDTHRKWW